MPSTRSALYRDEIPTGTTTRDLPPASEELLAPADVKERADARHRHRHPAKIGRPREDDETMKQTALHVYEAVRQSLAPRELAEEIECTPARAKELIATAKDRMAARIDEYVDAHLVATKIAAVEGDAKPSQWFLENFATREGERVIDPPAKNLPPAAPTFNLGFVVGGMPQTVRQLPPVKES